MRTYPRLASLVCVIVGLHLGMSEWPERATAVETAAIEPEPDSSHLRAKVLLLLNDGVVCEIAKQTTSGFEPAKDPVVLLGDFPQLAIGDRWEGDAFPAGYYQYRQLNGQNRTVAALATTRLAAQNHVSPPPPTPTPSPVLPPIILPPFGLKWGTKADQLQTLLKGAGAKITAQQEQDGKSVWHVEGLIQANLKETQFSFANETLTGVTLIYSPTGASSTKVADMYQQVRGRIVSRYGEPKKESIDGREVEALKEISSAHLRNAEWQQAGTALHLTYLMVEGPRSARELKVEYLDQVPAP